MKFVSAEEGDAKVIVYSAYNSTYDTKKISVKVNEENVVSKTINKSRAQYEFNISVKQNDIISIISTGTDNTYFVIPKGSNSPFFSFEKAD